MYVEFLVVPSFTSRCFSTDTPVFHFSPEPNFQTPVRQGIIEDYVDVLPLNRDLFIYLFIYLPNMRYKISIFFLRERVQPHRPRGSICSFTDFERYYEVHSSQLAECFSSSNSRSGD